MKGQRWKHIVVEEKEEGVKFFKEMKPIYRGGGMKRRWGRH